MSLLNKQITKGTGNNYNNSLISEYAAGQINKKDSNPSVKQDTLILNEINDQQT